MIEPPMPIAHGAERGPDGSLLLVGGGLQNALIALALLHENPAAQVCLIERQSSFGGNHTWCFHEGDVSPHAAAWLWPLVVKQWDAYEVAFPGRERRIEQRYSAITSEQLDRVLRQVLERAPNARVVHEDVVEVAAGRVRLGSGELLHPAFVVDARGPSLGVNGARHVQKFVGLELEVAEDTLPPVAVLMDARVPQRDGFRFFYVLPLAPNRVLVEDTYYADDTTLDRERLRAEIVDYARARGMVVKSIVREEHGVLPLPTEHVARKRTPGLLVAGYRGGFFHPTTGYSLPCALRVAEHFAAHWPNGIEGSALDELFAHQQRQARYCIWLNRMLFGAFAPEQRFGVLERFYGLPAETIRRFYALDMTAADRTRIVCGRPPKGFSAWRLYQTLGSRTQRSGEAKQL